jgi:hypothetical protein
MVGELGGVSGTPRVSAFEDFDDEHVTLVTNRACRQGRAGEFFVTVAVILLDLATSLGERHF